MSRTAKMAAAVAAGVLVVVLMAVALLVLLADGEATVEGGRGSSSSGSISEDCVPATPEDLSVEVVRTIPHDPTAYTQGLVSHDGRLFESTGREGESTVRELDPDTGEVLDRAELPSDVFGEGLTMTADGRLVQLTWLDRVAYSWDPDALDRTADFELQGEGWGLTTLDDGTLVSSDGSDVVTLRDPSDLAPMETRRVRRADGPADMLNELDWDGNVLWANRYESDELLRIDLDCGTVTGVADLTSLREDAESVAAERSSPIDVTNGVAHLAGTDRYLLTGKWWPTMYEVRIS